MIVYNVIRIGEGYEYEDKEFDFSIYFNEFVINQNRCKSCDMFNR